jgi:hypothetical protein
VFQSPQKRNSRPEPALIGRKFLANLLFDFLFRHIVTVDGYYWFGALRSGSGQLRVSACGVSPEFRTGIDLISEFLRVHSHALPNPPFYIRPFLPGPIHLATNIRQALSFRTA